MFMYWNLKQKYGLNRKQEIRASKEPRHSNVIDGIQIGVSWRRRRRGGAPKRQRRLARAAQGRCGRFEQRPSIAIELWILLPNANMEPLVKRGRGRWGSSEEEDVSDDNNAVDVSAFLTSKFRKFGAEEDEDEIERLIAVRKRFMLRRMAASLLVCCKDLIDSYVSYRGGLNELRNFVPGVRVFDPKSFDDKMFVAFFRFEREEIAMIIQDLNLPSFIVSPHRDKDSTFNVFCMMCCKFAYPLRFCGLVREFGRSQSSISRLVSTLRKLLYERFHFALRNPAPFTSEECACFASHIRTFCGHPIVVGFIDGTVRQICKPTHLQNPMYNGKDRIHSLKYQAITTPDGIIRHLAGPYPGSRHDQFMLRESGILDWLAGFPLEPEHKCPYAIYADAGYSVQPGILIPFHDPEINPIHAGYNAAMSSVRISVEWAFGAILTHWAALRHVPDQQLLSNRKIGQTYFVAALLTNFLDCVRPNATSQYFSLKPPSLTHYLEWLQENSRRVSADVSD